jgi:hypothetical protein
VIRSDGIGLVSKLEKFQHLKSLSFEPRERNQFYFQLNHWLDEGTETALTQSILNMLQCKNIPVLLSIQQLTLKLYWYDKSMDILTMSICYKS